MPTLYPLTTIYPGTDFLTIPTGSASAITTASSSGSIKVNTLMVTNTLSGSAATVTVDVYRNSTSYVIINALSIPAASVAVLIGKDSPIYLKALDSLRLVGNTNAALKAVSSYEIIE